MNIKEKNTSGLQTSEVLLLIFIVLKLTDNISWSWLWVTCPIWIEPIILFFVLLPIYKLCFFLKRKVVKRKINQN